ncbi:hypothetical protein WJX72_009562 [[Myrmecia] bisecta]|uniref:SH2 domain-containing protein n=1 Tax=[Myrmecia] bisecta TaxID=41462 RepID=A0AAW1PSH5_9CHLO
MGQMIAEDGPQLPDESELVGMPQPDIEMHQQHWVRYSTMQEARCLKEWRQEESLLIEATQSFGDMTAPPQLNSGVPLAVSLKLLQAPAAFNRPMVQRKTFKPAFMVELELRYRGALNLNCKVEAYPMHETQNSKPSTWKPERSQQQLEIDNCTMTRQIQVGPPIGEAPHGADAPREYSHKEYFEFTDLRFIKSSRMSKRWLAFTCQIKGDFLYVIYTLPAVVISRRADQYNKAYETLTGTPLNLPKRARLTVPSNLAQSVFTEAVHSAINLSQQPHAQPPVLTKLQTQMSTEHLQVKGWTRQAGPPGTPAGVSELEEPQPAVIEPSYVHSWILQRYRRTGFSRQLTEQDMLALERQAGVSRPRGAGSVPRQHVGSSGSDPSSGGEGSAGATETAVDPVKWGAFREWFAKCLKALSKCNDGWNRNNPTWICGFAVDRNLAEQLLHDRPMGAFLVRMCSEPGSFAISCRMGEVGPGAVDHLLVDCVDLQGHTLQSYVLANDCATHLLDPVTGQLHRKEMVFGTSQQLLADNLLEQQLMMFANGNVRDANPEAFITAASLGYPSMSLGLGAYGAQQAPPPAQASYLANAPQLTAGLGMSNGGGQLAGGHGSQHAADRGGFPHSNGGGGGEMPMDFAVTGPQDSGMAGLADAWMMQPSSWEAGAN